MDGTGDEWNSAFAGLAAADDADLRTLARDFDSADLYELADARPYQQRAVKICGSAAKASEDEQTTGD